MISKKNANLNLAATPPNLAGFGAKMADFGKKAAKLRGVRAKL